MAKPNYQFEKRQRELKKAKQQEEKRLKKLAGNAGDEMTAVPDASEGAADATPTTPEQLP